MRKLSSCPVLVVLAARGVAVYHRLAPPKAPAAATTTTTTTTTAPNYPTAPLTGLPDPVGRRAHAARSHRQDREHTPGSAAVGHQRGRRRLRGDRERRHHAPGGDLQLAGPRQGRAGSLGATDRYPGRLAHRGHLRLLRRRPYADRQHRDRAPVEPRRRELGRRRHVPRSRLSKRRTTSLPAAPLLFAFKGTPTPPPALFTTAPRARRRSGTR